MKHRFFFKIFIFVIIMFSICYGIFLYVINFKSRIQHINVVSDCPIYYIPEHDIIEFVNHSKDNWLFFNVKNIMEQIYSYPGVSAVKVKKIWPSNLNIYISEYQPIAFWNDTKNILLSNRKIIAPYYFNLEIILPIFNTDIQDADILTNKYYKFSRILEKSGYKIVQLSYLGNEWKIVLNNNIVILLGRNNMEKKLFLILKNMSNIRPNRNKKINIIDMRYKSGFSLKTI